MQDGTYLTSTNWQSQIDSNNQFLLTRWNPQGELLQSVSLSPQITPQTQNVPRIITSSTVVDDSLYIGVGNEGLLKLPLVNSQLAPQIWSMDSIWQTERIRPKTAPVKLHDTQQQLDFDNLNPDIIANKYEQTNLSKALMNYPQSTVTSLNVTAPFNQSFSQRLFANQPGVTVSLGRVNLNNAISWLNADFVSGTIWGKPTGNIRGTYTIHFELVHEALIKATRLDYEKKIQVNNNSPIFTSDCPDTLEFSFGEQGKCHKSLPNCIFDQENDAITWQAPALPDSPSWFSLTKDGCASVEGLNSDDQKTKCSVTITAKDKFNAASSKKFKLSILGRPPQLKMDFDTQYVSLLGSIDYSIEGHFEDPDNDPITYTVDTPDWLVYDDTSKKN